MTRRRTEITVETERLLIIRGHKKAVAWCAACQQHREMLTIDEAALRVGVSSRAIFRWVESGTIHYTETADGLLLICPTSLPQN